MRKLLNKWVALVLIVTMIVISPIQANANTISQDIAKIVSISCEVFKYGGSNKIKISCTDESYYMIDMKIYNSKNVLVKSLGYKYTYIFGGNVLTFLWDGKDAKKKYVKDGTYKAKIYGRNSNDSISFVVKKKPLKSDYEKTIYGKLIMNGYTAKIPSDWGVGMLDNNFFVRSPKKAGTGNRCIVSFKNTDYTGAGMTESFIKSETIKRMDKDALKQTNGKIIGSKADKIGTLSGIKKTYEYKATSANNIILKGETSFLATIKSFMSLKKEVVYSVEIAYKKGKTIFNNKISKIINSLKISTFESDSNWTKVIFSGQTKFYDVRCTLPAGTFAINDSYNSQTYNYGTQIYYGNPISFDDRFTSIISDTDNSDYDYAETVTEVVNYLKAYFKDEAGPKVKITVEDITIDELPVKKVTGSLIDESLKTVYIEEFLVFRLYSSVYTFATKILMNKSNYSKGAYDKFLAVKKELIDSIKLAPEELPTIAPSATPTATPIVTPVATPSATPSATPIATSTPTPITPITT